MRPRPFMPRMIGLSVLMLGSYLLARRGFATSTREKTAVSVALRDEERGRHADVPEHIPARGLRDVFWRVIHEISDDRVTLIAGGVTFYSLLALFPALAATVSLYGFVAEPANIAARLGALSAVLPPGALELISDQLNALVEQRASSLSLSFLIGLAIALWSSHSGTMAIFDAMNIAYEEREKRGIVRLNLIALIFTLCEIAGAILIIGLVAVLPLVLSYLWLDSWSEQLALVLRWPFLLAVVMIAVSCIYRFGPSRQSAKARWLTWGSAFTAFSWLIMSMVFSLYLRNFANYEITYGALGALMGFLIWTWLSVIILIVGAEINAELEHQTALDTTTGPPAPMGSRGAYVADTLGKAAD